MSCELEFKNVYNKLRAYIKWRDSFQGADLICRIGKPQNYPERCERRNRIQTESLKAENELFDAFMDLSTCVKVK